MLRFFAALFNKNVSYHEIIETKEPRDTNIIYRDELSKNCHKKRASSTNHRPGYGDVCFASSKPKNNMQRRSGGGVVEEGGAIRVKVVMTKQEAARLLSKCKEGGVLGFKDTANELLQIPMNRVSVVSPACNIASTCGAALTSIPEEF
ncbi:hypothetical protein ACOSP7_024694 [Xanthoceras sorbifolium]